MRTSHERVLSIYVVAALTRAASRIPSVSLSRNGAIVAILVPAPFAWLIETAMGSSVEVYAAAVLTLYTLLNALALLWPHATWKRWVALAPDVEAVIPDDADSMAVARWAHRRLRLRPQWLLSAAAAALSVLVAAWVDRALRGEVDLGVAYYVLIAETGALGANVVYWLVQAPLLLKQACQADRLAVRWIEPLATPALAASARLMMRAAWMAMIAVLLFVAPIYWTRALAPDDVVLGVIAGLGVVGSLATVAFVGLAPQYWIWRMAARHRQAALDSIAALLPSDPLYDQHGNARDENAERLAERYALIRGMPASPLDRGTSAQLIGMVVVALAPVFIDRLFPGPF